MFGKSSVPLTKRGIKKMDALVTGMILGGIVASIYGIKKDETSRELMKKKILAESDKHSLGAIIRMLVFGVPADGATPLETRSFWGKIQDKVSAIFL